MISAPRLILPLFAALLLASCATGLSSQPPQEQRFYVLHAERQGAPLAAPAPGICKVKRFTVSPGYATRELIYRVDDSTYESDYYNQFHSSPADLMTQAARRWVIDAGLFEHVAEPSSDVRPVYILEGNVVTLHGDFSAATPTAVLEMQFFLLKDEEFDYRIRLDATYRREIPLAGKSAADVVDALNQGLAEILAQLEHDLAAALP